MEQLEDLFLLVVVGEFNSGKSSFLNALLGKKSLDEGVTPTTAQIDILRFGDKSAIFQPIDYFIYLVVQFFDKRYNGGG